MRYRLIKINGKLQEVLSQEVLTVQEVCDLFLEGKVKVGDKLDIYGKHKTSFGVVLTTTHEIVYDLFENHYFDTVINKIDEFSHPENGCLGRYRYFSEGFRSSLPTIEPEELAVKNSQLINLIKGVYKNVSS